MPHKVKALIVRMPTMPFCKDGLSLTSVSSSTFLLPLGAIYVATYSRELGGYDVQILDLNISLIKKENIIAMNGGYYSPQEIVRLQLIDIINDYKPDVVGFSSIFLSDEEWTLYCTEVVKSLNEKIIIVVGGSLATIETNRILSRSKIDCAVLGEGEVVFKNLLDCLSSKQAVSRIKGLAFKDKEKVIINEREELISDLDSIPIPDLSLVPLEMYPRDVLNRVYLFASRGCPSQCTFCSSFKLWTRKVRQHSIDRVLTEIRRLRDVYHIYRFDFWDENFTINPVWLKKLCEAMRCESQMSGILVKWGCPAGIMVKTLNTDFIKLMHNAGCEEFRLAIESGSERVAREILNKPINYNIVLKLRDVIRDIGAVLTSNFMMGVPGETLREMQQTVDFIAQLDSDWSIIAIYTPIPGTELYRVALEMGVIDNTLSRVRSQATLSTKNFSKEEVKKIQYDANIKYNFLQNRNVLRLQKGLQLEFYREFLEHVVKIYNKHIICKIVLGYVWYLDGIKDKAEYWWNLVKDDLKDPLAQRDFSEYLQWDNQLPLREWNRFIK